MYGQTALVARTMNHAGLDLVEAGGARRWAAQKFQQILLGGTGRDLWARLTGRSNRLQSLTVHEPDRCRQHALGLREVPLARIVGSEGRASGFDAEFRPRQSHTRERWIGIAAARRQGVTLPPVTLIQIGDDYFVRDGNHRVSVARALGEMIIDADVVVWA